MQRGPGQGCPGWHSSVLRGSLRQRRAGSVVQRPHGRAQGILAGLAEPIFTWKHQHTKMEALLMYMKKVPCKGMGPADCASCPRSQRMRRNKGFADLCTGKDLPSSSVTQICHCVNKTGLQHHLTSVLIAGPENSSKIKHGWQCWKAAWRASQQ